MHCANLLTLEIAIFGLKMMVISSLDIIFLKNSLSLFIANKVQLIMNHQLLLNNSAEEVCSFWDFLAKVYRISSYSFCGNYSLLNFEIQRSQYIRPKVTLHKDAETIQGRKLYMIAYKNNRNKFSTPVIFHKMTCLLRSLKL